MFAIHCHDAAVKSICCESHGNTTTAIRLNPYQFEVCTERKSGATNTMKMSNHAACELFEDMHDIEADDFSLSVGYNH